jgi:hypothetical protein
LGLHSLLPFSVSHSFQVSRLGSQVSRENEVLAEPDWLARRAAHERRVRAWTDPHQARQARGEKHPVEDFLFEYYRFRASWLRRWHPGPDVVLLGAAARDYLQWPEYQEISLASPVPGSAVGASLPVRRAQGLEPAERLAISTASSREQARSHGNAGSPNLPQFGVMLNPATFAPKRRDSLAWMLALLRATAERPPQFACYGLHEWAMVYRQTPDEVRHNQWPLRFPPDELARIVEAQPVRCSHFDAFRFFTAPARPLNKLQPERATSAQFEQRGCLHANMDLYKWAFKLAPFTPSELTADCFALARDIRETDMRASPYDFRALGHAPIAIETPEGRAEYERHQRAFAERSQPLRARLIALGERLLGM